MFAGQYFNLDLAMAAVMLTLLIVAAFFDANGAEVPDELTVPYALSGIIVSVLHERWGAAVVAVLLVGFILSGWSPKWIQELNAKLMARAYPSEEALREETERLAVRAARYAKSDHLLLTSVLGMVLAFFIFGSVIGIMSLTETQARVRYIVAVAVCALSLYRLKLQTERTTQAGEPEKAEPLSAVGGADVIVFAGLLGFYGGIPFVYVMAATMVGVFILAVLFQLVRGKKGSVGIPLLPGILLMAPLRIFILVTYCPKVLQAFGWASGNLGFWMN